MQALALSYCKLEKLQSLPRDRLQLKLAQSYRAFPIFLLLSLENET